MNTDTYVTRISHRPINGREYVITKRLSLGSNGEIVREAGGQAYDADVERIKISDLESFGQIVANLAPNQALIYGALRDQNITRLMSKKRRDALIRETGAIDPTIGCRTKDDFHWGDPGDGGVMMIDYDPGPEDKVLSREELVDMIRNAVSGLEKVQMLWIPSASSQVYNASTGEMVYGIRGQRLYFRVADACDIPRAGKVLFDRLWLAGNGRIEISRSGQQLVRGPCDSSVWSPERLDFAAGSACEAPLEQRRDAPVIIEGSIEVANTSKLIPNLSPKNKAEVRQLIQTEKASQRNAADMAKQDYIRQRHADMFLDDGSDINTFTVFKSAMESRNLPPNFIIHVVSSDPDTMGEIKRVPVQELLDKPGEYHGERCLDPLEPEYHDEEAIGILYLSTPTPNIYSFAHGGRTLYLVRQRETITMRTGAPLENREAICRVLRDTERVYEKGNIPMYLCGDQLKAFDEPTAAAELGRFFRVQKPVGKKGELVPCDLPTLIIKDFLGMNGGRGLLQVKAVSSIPLVTMDGEIIQEPGYNAEHEILYLPRTEAAACPTVPQDPSDEEIAKAAEKLKSLYRETQFSSPHDLAIAVSGLLSACCRPLLPTCPGFAFEAPMSSSGKTYLGQILATMVSGEPAAVTSSPEDNAEWKKTLISYFLSGGFRDTIFIDNVRGVLSSEALEAFITGSNFSGRILGQSRTVSFTPRCVVIVTGNNMTMNVDNTRRFLRCTLAPKEDSVEIVTKPYHSDPLMDMQTNRADYAWAACVLLRAGRLRHQNDSYERLGTFEQWCDMILPALKAGGFEGDPIHRIKESRMEAYEASGTTDLLRSMYSYFGDNEFSAQELLQAARKDAEVRVLNVMGKEYHELDLALEKASGKSPNMWSAKSIGWALKDRVGMHDSGYVLQTRASSGRGIRYRVIKSE